MFELEKLVSGAKEKELCRQIALTNDKAAEYGLTLTENDIQMLAAAGKDSLKTAERVEFGESVIPKIIERFMSSGYISQSDYADTIAGLIDVFYAAKEESDEALTDDEVIDIMYRFFEHESGGDIETLQSRDMEKLCKKIRYDSGITEDIDYE